MLLTQGIQLNNIGRHDAAVSVLGKAIVAAPQAVEPHCEMAFALFSLRRLHDALKEAEVAASLDPQYERPHRLRSIILMQLDRPKDALVAAETAVRLAPDLPSDRSNQQHRAEQPGSRTAGPASVERGAGDLSAGGATRPQ
jgi:Flp pilus assembly protein TadD